MCVECGDGQAASLLAMASGAGWARFTRIIADLGGWPRGVWIDTTA